MGHVSLEQAIICAELCSGENAPDLANMNVDNALQMRKEFLLNVAYNGGRSHAHIIIVLQYMAKFFPSYTQSLELDNEEECNCAGCEYQRSLEAEMMEDLKNECELNGLECQSSEC